MDGMAWQTSHTIMVYPCMGYSMALRESHIIVVLASIAWYMVMAWQARNWAWHSIWYGLAGKESYMVWPGKHVMVYGMAWRAALHGVWYGLAGLAWYIVWPGGHRMVLWYILAWDIVWPYGHRIL